jgi:hypothetical protein
MQFVNRVAESRARRATFARMLARGTLGARRINDTLWVLASSGSVGRVVHDLSDRAGAGRVTDAIQSNRHRVRKYRPHQILGQSRSSTASAVKLIVVDEHGRTHDDDDG